MLFKHVDLPLEEQRELAVSLKKDYKKQNMEKLICSFSKFLHLSASKHNKRLHNKYYEDLYLVGAEALFDAISKYDPEKNNNFFRYAILWIHAKMKKFQQENISVFHMGDKAFYKLYYSKNSLEDSSEEIAKKLNLSVDDVNDFKKALKICKPLIKSNEEDDGEEEYICSNMPLPENVIAFSEIKKLSDNFMKSLSERDKLIWSDFLSFEGNHAEIALILGCTRESVRQRSNLLQEAFKDLLIKHEVSLKNCSLIST